MWLGLFLKAGTLTDLFQEIQLSFSGVLHALEWSKNILWAHPRPSVCRVLLWGWSGSLLRNNGSRGRIVGTHSCATVTSNHVSAAIIKVHCWRSLFLMHMDSGSRYVLRNPSLKAESVRSERSFPNQKARIKTIRFYMCVPILCVFTLKLYCG